MSTINSFITALTIGLTSNFAQAETLQIDLSPTAPEAQHTPKEDRMAHNRALIDTHNDFTSLLEGILADERHFDPEGYQNSPFFERIYEPYTLSMQRLIWDYNSPLSSENLAVNPVPICFSISVQNFMQNYAITLDEYTQMVADVPEALKQQVAPLLQKITELGQLNQEELYRAMDETPPPLCTPPMVS